jgi:hypothetical protein
MRRHKPGFAVGPQEKKVTLKFQNNLGYSVLETNGTASKNASSLEKKGCCLIK